MKRPDLNQLTEFGTVLHQLNQPLTAIGNYAQAGSAMLAGGTADQAALQMLFDKINQQAARGFAISRELGTLVNGVTAGTTAGDS